MLELLDWVTNVAVHIVVFLFSLLIVFPLFYCITLVPKFREEMETKSCLGMFLFIFGLALLFHLLSLGSASSPVLYNLGSLTPKTAPNLRISI